MVHPTRLVFLVAALVPAAACEVPESATSLNPEGPPMIQQVFLTEPDATGRPETVLAFGTHPAVPDERIRPATRALPAGQTIRVVFDELLIGNYLEEVACTARNGVVGCPAYSPIPEGTTPDDIANCADQETLDDRCRGEFTVCMNSDGVPCGIRDTDQPGRPADGAPDDLRLIAGAAKIRCGNIEVGVDDQGSFWQPSGNQQIPSGKLPESSLGPALVLRPLNNGLLPTNQTDCRLVLAPNVVDKDHVAVCTPAGGTLDGACTPGDLGGFKFGTAPLSAIAVQPEGPGTLVTSRISITLNTVVDDANLTSVVTVTEAGVVRADATVERASPGSTPPNSEKNRIDIRLPGGLLPNTAYMISATPKDSFGVVAPTPITFTFTTGA